MTQMAKCSQCLKELVMEEVRYHSPINFANNTVEHVWCDAECSHKWHTANEKYEESLKKRPNNQWPSHESHGG